MRSVNSFGRWILMVLGLIGIVVCLLGMIGVWVVDSHLTRATHRVFGLADGALVFADDRVSGIQENVWDARITSSELVKVFSELEAKRLRQRIAEDDELVEKARTMQLQLEQVNDILLANDEALNLAKRGIEIANSLGSDSAETKIANLQQDIEKLQTQLEEVISNVDRVTQLLGSVQDEPDDQRDFVAAASFMLRIVATLDTVQEGFVELHARLERSRQQARTANGKATRWIHVGAWSMTLLLLWMLAGQFALVRLSWIGRKTNG